MRRSLVLSVAEGARDVAAFGLCSRRSSARWRRSLLLALWTLMDLVAYAVEDGFEGAEDVVVAAAVVCALADIVAQLLSISLELASAQWSCCLPVPVAATKAIQRAWV